MFKQGIKVDFIVCKHQACQPIQLGVNLTEGLGGAILIDNSQLLKVSLTSKNVDRNTKMVLLLPMGWHKMSCCNN
jgi:hypothetical protein